MMTKLKIVSKVVHHWILHKKVLRHTFVISHGVGFGSFKDFPFFSTFSRENLASRLKAAFNIDDIEKIFSQMLFNIKIHVWLRYLGEDPFEGRGPFRSASYNSGGSLAGPNTASQKHRPHHTSLLRSFSLIMQAACLIYFVQLYQYKVKQWNIR